MKIGFHSNQLGLRGTDVALFEYAYYARQYLNIDPVIISDANANLDAVEKFRGEFLVALYQNFNEVPQFVADYGIDAMYYQKGGHFDGKLVPGIPNLVHAVFQIHQPHGERHAYISKWLAEKMGGPGYPYVPYMVDIQRHSHAENYREYLNIPKTAMVFGFHGGRDSFNIPWAKEAVIESAKKRPDAYFLFLNSDSFGEPLPNVLFLEGTYDMGEKVAFLNTLDVGLHARNGGESFGLSVAEYTVLGKPVITTSWCNVALNDLAHLDMLGDTAIIYNNKDELSSILQNISHHDIKDFVPSDYYATQCSPEVVMQKFKEVFL
jgi:hypothetical protein